MKNLTIYHLLFMLLVMELAACERPSPEEVRERQHLPKPGFIADINQGNILFHNNCSQCHGLEGKGTRQGPPLVHQTYHPRHHSDLVFHWAVRDGVKQHHWKFGAMPPQPQISPEDAAHIIAYIRQQQRDNGIQ